MKIQWLRLFSEQVLAELHPGMVISTNSVLLLHSYIVGLTRVIGKWASYICQIADRLVITSLEMQVAVRLWLQGELGKFAVAKAVRAVTIYM